MIEKRPLSSPSSMLAGAIPFPVLFGARSHGNNISASWRRAGLTLVWPPRVAETNISSVPDVSADMAAKDAGQARLSNKLYAAFDATPLEDGMDHAAEAIIGEALKSSDGPRALAWLKILSLDAARPSFASSVLRCLGRQDRPGTAAWRTALVQVALTVDDVEIRDGAVQAAESWADRELHDILKSHPEPVPWLRDYIQDVMHDLIGG